jgi:putative heme-binding domain-containing protein
LQGWIANQGEENFLRLVINPSEQISQGYNGSTVRLKDGGEVQGLVLSAKNPVIVQSQGGLVQMIPAGKVEKVEDLKHSLMLSADQSGLNAQDLADLTAYLKTLK